MSCVTREVELPLEAGEAWEAVTELSEWLVDDADLVLEAGSEGTMVMPGGEERHAVVEEVSPRERLAFWWWADDAPATRVELTLVPAVSGTLVRVVESGWASMPFAAGVGLPRQGPLAAAAFVASPSLPVGHLEIRLSHAAGALPALVEHARGARA
jgi:uncharacterized protein YndB with AHSA1/START domain